MVQAKQKYSRQLTPARSSAFTGSNKQENQGGSGPNYFSFKFIAALAFSLSLFLLFGCIFGGGGNETPTPAATVEPTGAPTPLGTPLANASPLVNATPLAECGTAADCEVLGCAGQWCKTARYPQPLACTINESFACLNQTACVCAQGTCAWNETENFRGCMANASARCRAYAKPMGEFVDLCRARGGEPTALPDSNGCFLSSTCSSDISCGENAECPLGFSCEGEKCIPSPQFCGGIGGIGCMTGFTCVFNGAYPDATGECMKECTASEECGTGRSCSGGVCSINTSVANGSTGNGTNANGTVSCGPGLVKVGNECVSPLNAPCVGPSVAACPDGYYCATSTFCREGQTCLDLNGTCQATRIPVNLSRLCDRPTGSITYLDVTGISACTNSGYFQIHRDGNRRGFAYSNGTIFRECGASAPNRDPICGGLETECGSTVFASCTDLKSQRLVHCPPPHRSNSNCPQVNEPVCAYVMNGAVPALRQLGWQEFGNGCLACAGSNQTMIVEGFMLGKCS